MSSISDAIKQICDEKGLAYDSVLETVEAALAAAYRKDYGNKMQNIKVEFDPESGSTNVFDVKTVVEDQPDLPEEDEAEAEPEEKPKKEKKATKKETEEKNEKSPEEPSAEEEDANFFNPKTQIQLSEAQELKKGAKLDDEIKTELELPGTFGRMAAQTAKQVIIQKLREAERETLYNEFSDKEGELMVGTVQRREGRLVLVDLHKLTALLIPEEQIDREPYNSGERIKVYIMSVKKTSKGPEVIVSRAHPEIVKKLFATEIPEIANGVVEIKGIAREAGQRTKIAVWTDEDNIDPIGSCIGQRGARVQTIISELKGEKIDIIEYSDEVEEYITNSLSPAKINEIKLDEDEKTATIVVADDQLSLAIGKSGQNVRLASKLTGWKLNVVSDESDGKSAKKEEKDESDDEVAKDSGDDAPEDKEAEAKVEDDSDKEEKDDPKKKPAKKKSEKKEVKVKKEVKKTKKKDS